MPQKIASLTLLALTAFYSVSASAQPGPPRSPNSRGPQSHGQHGPQHRGPQSHGQRGPQDRGSQPQTRAPQSRPDQRPGVAPSVDKRAEAARIMEMTKRAVESGQMTREQAMERFNAWRQRNGIERMPIDRPQTDRAPQRGPQPQGRPPQSRPDQRPVIAPSVDMREQGAKILQALRKAVEAGEITPEQARERFNAWRQRISGKASQPAPQTQSRPAVPAAKEIPVPPVPPVRPAERKPQSAQGAKLKSEAIPATKIQPSRIFQLPPKKKEKK